MDNNLTNYWDSESLRARISDPYKRIRYEAGSPNSHEIECYGDCLSKGFSLGAKKAEGWHVAILGMTPELRHLAHKMRCSVTCVDFSEEAIKLYRDWICEEHRIKENIVQADWIRLPDVLNKPADAILGDGVFGNITSLQGYTRLLRALRESLCRDGFLVFRTIMVPSNINPDDHAARQLLKRFKAGELTEAEFGFGMRIFGSYSDAYNVQTFILDNKEVFARYEDWLKKGLLSEPEYAAIRRYCYAGPNLIPPQKVWETMLLEEGFSFQQYTLKGKMWYEYYPIYYCLKIEKSWGETA